MLEGRWLLNGPKAGHHLFLGVKDTTQFKGKHLLNNPNTEVHSVAQAVQAADVILVATPPQIALDLVDAFGDVTQKVIIDATNAVHTKPLGYATAFHAFEALTNAAVVKSFNTTGFENLQNPDYGQATLDMFMAGDSDFAKTPAHQLALDAGFENCYDFGKSDKVVLLEQFALPWINLAIMQGLGRDVGFKLLKRSS